MSRSTRVAVLTAIAAGALAAPAVLFAQRVPTVERPDLTVVRQVGTVDVDGRTLPLFRGDDGVRAPLSARGGVIRLSGGDVEVVVPPGAVAEGGVGALAERGWPSKVPPLRRVGPALRLGGDLGGASGTPFEVRMRVRSLEPVEGHRLVLVGTKAPESADRSSPLLATIGGGSQLGVGRRRALKMKMGFDGKGNDVVTEARAAPSAPDQDAWFGTLSGTGVHVVPAHYDRRSGTVTARFDGEGAYEAFEIGWIPESVLEDGLMKRPGRIKQRRRPVLRR